MNARLRWMGVVVWTSLLAAGGPASMAAEPEIHWKDRLLTISGDFPGQQVVIQYLEAYCRAGSTDRDWAETVIPHSSRLVPTDHPRALRVEDKLADGVVVVHDIAACDDGVTFVVTARNPTDRTSAAAWAQPCVRVDRFTGSDPARARDLHPPYIQRCFVMVDGKPLRLPTAPWATEARYVPGQVYCPATVPRGDVNPRPLSSLVPSHGLCGCVSADGRWVLGVAWEPYQEIFQGVVTCLHADFRIGGLEPGETKTIRGRLYLLPGDEETLVAAYRRDFPEQAVGVAKPSGAAFTERAEQDGEKQRLQVALDVLRAVGPEGHGNAAAAAAWQEVAEADATAIPTVLTAIDGAGPLAANWLRAAVDAIAGKAAALPLPALEAFLVDQRHDPRARRLAYELLRSQDAARAEAIIAGLLDDPSVELRRDAVSRLIAAADRQQTEDAEAALATLRRALDAARDVDQIEDITKRLRKGGVAVDLQRQFGFLAHWHLIGPFDNTAGEGFAAVYPPETEIRLDATYQGKGVEARWKPFMTADDYGMVDINKAYPGPDDGLKEVVAYAFTPFEAMEARDAEIRLGCKNAWKVWHNDTLVFARDEYHRGMRIDQYRLPIRLKAGQNTILVKLCQDAQTKEWTKEWQFQMRVCDSAGTAILAVDRPPTPLPDALPTTPAATEVAR